VLAAYRPPAAIDWPRDFITTSASLKEARAFGDVSAMPTLLLFDGQGSRVASFLGAPPALHGEVEARLEPLLR
jgi:hypothetical protein